LDPAPDTIARNVLLHGEKEDLTMVRTPRSLAWLLVLAAVLCMAGTTIAEDQAQPAPTGKVVVYDTPTAAGMTAEQEAHLRAVLAPRLNRSDEGLVEVVDPDGGISMDPQGRFQEVILVRIAPDGTLEIGTFDELESAMRFLKYETTTPVSADSIATVE
jgi:hypothetical protein